MKRYVLWLAVCLCTILSFGQAVGSWKIYPALQIATDNVPAGDKIYSLCNGNLYSYNPETTEVYVYDRINGLHDTGIQFIRYCKAVQKLMVVYENGNIDLIYPDDEVVNLKHIKDMNYTNLVINNIDICGKTAYVCTNSGIIAVNLELEEFTATYNLELNVLACMEYNGFIYMSTNGNGWYKGDLTRNLLDKGNWEKVSDFTFDDIALLKDQLICWKKGTGILQIDKNTLATNTIEGGWFTFFNHNDDMLITGHAYRILILKSAEDKQDIPQANNFSCLTYHKGAYWASQGKDGLQPYKIEEEALVPAGSAIQPDSPIRDYFCNMHYDGNRLLVAGGNLNYNDIIREGTVMYYEDGKWHNFSEENITEQTHQRYIDVTCVAQDPQDPTHHFVSSSGQGLYEFKDLKYVRKFDCENSPLRTILPNSPNYKNYVRCSALNYDTDGNLWMINTEVDTLIRILKPDYTWARLYYPEISKSTTCNYFIKFDRKGRVWVPLLRMNPRGIFFLDYNGTLENTADDTHLLRTEIINQDGISYTPNSFFCITEDREGQLWIGTDMGPFVISNPDDFTNDDFTYTQIKIARNDGTDYADYLLNGVAVTAIAVDDANRKWIGTAQDGVYLVSADGQEMIQHFTTENSPLISDEIESMDFNSKTGEVMIGTIKGLVSYTSDAKEAENEMEKSNIRVYPNPVRPDYNGVITVDGLTDNAEIKITTVTGQLIYSGTSNGGRFTWNGRNQNGRRVSSGVYNVISSNQEGKKAVVSRITFIH